MCRLIAYKNKQMRNKGSYHVWSILQKFRGFKLICKHYFMHKEKKANIIIETNKAISWVKSSINDGLNKQSNLLGKINPKCTLLPSPNWFVFNPVFFRVCRVCSLLRCAKLKQTAERCILFFFLFYKKAKIIFLLFMYTNKSRPFTIPIIFMTKRSCFHCWKGNKSSLSSFKHSTKCSLFIIIIKTTGQTYGKNTLLCLNM